MGKIMEEYGRSPIDELRRSFQEQHEHARRQLEQFANPPVTMDTETQGLNFRQEIRRRWVQSEYEQAYPRMIRAGESSQRRYWAEYLRRARDLLERNSEARLPDGWSSYTPTLQSYCLDDVLDKSPTKKKEEKPWLD